MCEISDLGVRLLLVSAAVVHCLSYYAAVRCFLNFNIHFKIKFTGPFNLDASVHFAF